MEQRKQTFCEIYKDLALAEEQGYRTPYPYPQLRPMFVQRQIDQLSIQIEANLMIDKPLSLDELLKECKEAHKPIQILKCMELLEKTDPAVILLCWHEILNNSFQCHGSYDTQFITEIVRIIDTFHDDIYVPFSGILTILLSQALQSLSSCEQVRNVVCLFVTRCHKSRSFVATELRGLLETRRDESWRLLVSECIVE